MQIVLLLQKLTYWPILNILLKMSCALYSLSMCVVWRWHITVEINECQDGDHNILHGCLSDLPRAFSINNLVDVSWNFHPIFLTESSRQLLYWAINHGAAVDICARQCATLERSHRSSLTIFSSHNLKLDLFCGIYLSSLPFQEWYHHIFCYRHQKGMKIGNQSSRCWNNN